MIIKLVDFMGVFQEKKTRSPAFFFARTRIVRNFIGYDDVIVSVLLITVTPVLDMMFRTISVLSGYRNRNSSSIVEYYDVIRFIAIVAKYQERALLNPHKDIGDVCATLA